MPYKIMMNLIQNGLRSKDDLLSMADVYFAVDRLTQEQYENIVAQIRHREEV